MTVRQGADRPRRRQARGERRIAQLLDAAARVFCTVGYQAASTNAIAREAGVSPGTLYQFFPNKEAIGEALSERLAVQIRDVHDRALSLDHSPLTLRELIDKVVDPLVRFNLENPVCFALLKSKSPDLPSRFNRDHDLLHSTMLARVKAIISARAPHLDQGALDRATDMCWAAFFGFLHVLFEKEDEQERATLVEEVKVLLYRYLEPVLGEEAPAARAEHTARP